MLHTGSFRALGAVNTVAVDQSGVLRAATEIVEALFRDVEESCSRLSESSELSELNRRAGAGAFRMSPLMEGAIVAALQTAEMSGGLVDPTMAWRRESELPAGGPAVAVRVKKVEGWWSLVYDPVEHTLTMPEGASIDLAASTKAWAADLAARMVEESLDVGVLVDCGGHVAVCGLAPDGGWPVQIGGRGGEEVCLYSGGLATSTFADAESPWSMVTVAAATCVASNAASTAALLIGEHATAWLDDLNLPARLVRADGEIVLTGGWAA